MSERGGSATNALARHLRAAIERVREDMAKVEFWADAVTGFSEPVPDYDSKDVNVWLPSEQAMSMSSAKRKNHRKRAGHSKPG